jgi:hypothetical protein
MVNAVFSLEVLVNRLVTKVFGSHTRAMLDERARYDMSPWTGDKFSLEGDDEKLFLKVDEKRVA